MVPYPKEVLARSLIIESFLSDEKKQILNTFILLLLNNKLNKASIDLILNKSVINPNEIIRNRYSNLEIESFLNWDVDSFINFLPNKGDSLESCNFKTLINLKELIQRYRDFNTKKLNNLQRKTLAIKLKKIRARISNSKSNTKYKK